MDVNEWLTGKPWDPEADEEYQAVLRQVRTIPPTCLRGFACTPKHSEEWDNQARWAIACKCGSPRGAVLGYPLDELSGQPSLKGLYFGPLAFRCASCDSITEMFDSRLHGYDAEFDKRRPPKKYLGYKGEGPRVASKCPKCRGTECAVVGSFSHSHFDHIEDDAALQRVSQDYFDGYGCHATCAACGHEACIAAFELA